MDFNSLEIEASRYEQQLRKHRRALHRIPELGYEEIKTHEYLMRHLEKLAPDDLRVFEQTGIRAVFRRSIQAECTPAGMTDIWQIC